MIFASRYLSIICHHIKEPLYTVEEADAPGGEAIFAYVDPRNHGPEGDGNRIHGVFEENRGISSAQGRGDAARAKGSFPLEASVIIPVKNRNGTVADAVKAPFHNERTSCTTLSW